MPSKKYHVLNLGGSPITSYIVSALDLKAAQALKKPPEAYCAAQFFINGHQTDGQAEKLALATCKALNEAAEIAEKVLEQNFMRSMHPS